MGVEIRSKIFDHVFMAANLRSCNIDLFRSYNHYVILNIRIKRHSLHGFLPSKTPSPENRAAFRHARQYQRPKRQICDGLEHMAPMLCRFCVFVPGRSCAVVDAATKYLGDKAVVFRKSSKHGLRFCCIALLQTASACALRLNRCSL